MDVISRVNETLDGFKNDNRVLDAYYSFEPWDVKKRPQWMIEQAQRDGIDLYTDEMMHHIGNDPHDFQSGIILSTAFCTSAYGGTSIGKSYPIIFKAVAMLTGVLPLSFQYDKGADTGAKRPINEDNIRRFGRFDSRSGTFIDNDETATMPEGWNEWDCGNIIGAGKFPEELILPPGGEIWLLTTQKVLLNFWWPRFTDPSRRIIPEHLIDKTQNGGFREKDRIVYTQRNGKICCITYDSNFDKAEGERAHLVIFDEEPPRENMFHSGMQHGDRVMLIETPYRGITWSRDVVFPKKKTSDYVSFHASQYDSPYQTKAKIDARRKVMPKYEIKARIWGIPSDVVGKPFFDYDKISLWVQRYAALPYKAMRFDPTAEFRGIRGLELKDGTYIPGLMDVGVRRTEVEELNSKSVWRVYEERLPDVAYLFLVDPAEGAEKPEEAQDVCASLIMRQPILEQKEERPKIVASLRSTLPTIAFARTCSFAMRYYHNATLGAETKRHEVNATFAAELRDWPYWYYMTVTSDKTGKPKKHPGFDCNAATRLSVFDLIGEWLDSYEENQYPEIPDLPLLIELMDCVVGKRGRPDHTRNGTLDTTQCFGIGLHILKFSPEQVRYHGSRNDLTQSYKRDKWMADRHPQQQVSNICGLGKLGFRN